MRFRSRFGRATYRAARLSIILLIVAATILPTSGANAEFDGDVRVWNEFMWRQFRTEDWTSYFWGELRWVDDGSYLGTWVAQQKFYHQINDDWKLGFGGAWIDVEKNGGPGNRLARWELELNRRWDFSDGSGLGLRNRLETRWWKKSGDRTEFVSRHRLTLSRPANWFGTMDRIDCSNEIFIDYNGDGFNENRFRPINMRFHFNEVDKFNVFLQVRSRRLGVDRDWQHAYVIGFGIRFN
jgi:hypothetical protein